MPAFSQSMPQLCKGITSKGRPCKIKVRAGKEHCRYHNAPETKSNSPRREQPVPDCNPEQEKKEEAIALEQATPEERLETCCICFEDNVKTEELLRCKHPVCSVCIRSLTKLECPMCRGPLEGKTVSPKLRETIAQRRCVEKNRAEYADRLVAIISQFNPYLTDEEAYNIYQEALG